MTNISLLKKMIKQYSKVAYTHNYIFGFTYKGNVYMSFTDSTILPYILKLDKASRGAGMALRFCPTVEQKLALLEGATVLCSIKYFNEVVASSKYNKGEIFEKMVTEYFGQEWEKDTVPFYKGADLTVDEIGYQLKYEKATFTNEKALANIN